MLVRSLKGTYHAALAFLQKKSIEDIINCYDVSVQLDGPFNGYAFREKLVQPAEVAVPPELDRFGMHSGRHIQADIAEIARQAIEHFKPVIVSYLGADCRLDDLYISWFVPSRAVERSISGGWHDDNCGHRLKLYVCLKGDGATPTVFLANSHRRRYRFRMSELARFFGSSDKRSRADEIYLRYRSGDAALFDTNGLHRGLYEEPSSDRVVLVAEFINRHKANRISGRAPCGPGSTRTGSVVFDADAYAILASTGLLDSSLVRRQGERFDYSLRNLTSAP